MDFVVDLRPEHVARFVEALGDDFYFSESRVAESVNAGGSFNIIALEEMFKVDVFAVKDKPFELSQLTLDGGSTVGSIKVCWRARMKQYFILRRGRLSRWSKLR